MTITVNLEDVFKFVTSDIFNNFLEANTNLSNQLFITNVLLKTIQYMLNDLTQNLIDKKENI